MFAVEYDAYGSTDVLQLRTVPAPGELQANEVLVRVAASSVNPKDTFVRKGRFESLTGKTFPRRAGYDFAGTVERIGTAVTAVAVGNVVYGMIDGWSAGAAAELLVCDEGAVGRAPQSVDAVSAAAMPLAAQTALQALSAIGELQAGQRVLVHGASGGVGMFATQIARALDADVTAVASAANESLCREFGARTFFAHETTELAMRGADYDVVFDVFGNLAFAEVCAQLTPTGIVVTTVPNKANFAAIAAPQRSPQRMRLVSVQNVVTDLARLAELVDRQKLRVHVDAVYPIARIRDAHAHVETKHTRGKVVVRHGVETPSLSPG